MAPRSRQDFDWDELLLFIKEGKVIPVLGKELLVVELEGKEVLWENHLAERLAVALGVNRELLSPQPDLNEVALAYLQEEGAVRRKIYSKIWSLVEEQPLPLPAPLRQLAGITHFKLFVSTFFSPLLVNAINEIRFGGERRTKSLASAPNAQPEDLPCEVRKLSEPYVYNLFGPLTSSTDYAVTEEDTLEFLYALQSETRRPKILFNEFRNNHLLFLGCSFPDWLARFFVRTIANERLLLPRETSHLIADTSARTDLRLALFLRQYKAEIFPDGGAVEFVAELYRRWHERYSSEPEAATSRQDPPGGRRMEPGDIFLSYASEDQPVVRALEKALKDAGLDVWFDEKQLQPGDSWAREIRDNIRRCSLFLPVLSRNAQRRIEGYFRKEWAWALDRAEGMDETFPFIQPILVDDLPERARGIPEGFWSRQCARFPGGSPSQDFILRTREAIRTFRLREAGRA